ncbi:MAG TPA: pyroglutamyl-peptidase I, partial [Rheinheimera sp.]|nr:pyroglutamyl-peptidase I [Rheinheimera sp.]
RASAESQVQVERLPCVFKHSLTVLEQLINRHKPSHLLLLSQCSTQATISVEKVALNINDARQSDNNNQQPRDSLTAQHGPAAYFSNLPVNAITDKLRSHQLPVQLSYNAGTFVANHLFYGLMHYIKHQNISLHGGLLQFPLLPQQACLQPGTASISSGLILDAVKLAVSVCLAHGDNMLRSTG